MSAAALLGTEVGDYLLEEVLGRGGMGVVYRARDLALDRPVAFKVLRPDLVEDSDARKRFQKEIMTAAKIEHQNVVPVYAGGYESGQFFIAMRLIEGADLHTVVGGKPLELDRALELFDQIALGLSWIHHQGLIHRDIKPPNVLISHPGEVHEHALLADFGIARVLDSRTIATLGGIGTAEYMAPEVAEWKPATPLSDQYSLACVLYEMIVGHSPFHGQPLPAAHLECPAPNPGDADRAVPEAVCAAIMRALSKAPEDRYESVTDFAAALRRPPTAKKPESARRVTARGSVRLHDELAAILSEAGNPWMPCDQLAERVTARGRYEMKSGQVAGQDVDQRTRSYPQVFRREGAKVRLRHS